MHYKFTNVTKINKEETRLLTENALIIYPIKSAEFWAIIWTVTIIAYNSK